MTIHPEVETLIHTVGRRVSGRFRAFIEPADVIQELYLWVLQDPSRTEAFLSEENEDARKEQAALLAFMLYRVAGRYCRREKALACGYETRDEAFYDSGVVEAALPAVFDSSHILARGEEDESAGRSKTPANEGNTVLAIVTDVKAAYQKLDRPDRVLLWEVYGAGTPQRAVAEIEGVAESTVSRRLDAAVKRIVEHLGGESPWSEGPGARRAIRNSQAIAITNQQEAGE